jgi:hypothetical protein
MDFNDWSFPQMLQRNGASARNARVRRRASQSGANWAF